MLASDSDGARQWHRVLLALRAVNALPTEELFTHRYTGFDPAITAELRSAIQWINAFTQRFNARD